MLPSPTSVEINPAGEQRLEVRFSRAGQTIELKQQVTRRLQQMAGRRAETADASLVLCFLGWGLGGPPLELLGARGTGQQGLGFPRS